MARKKHILMIVENNSLPLDRRVWHEAMAGREFGYKVSAICPANKITKKYGSIVDGVRIYRHPHIEGVGIGGLLLEYFNALLWEIILAFWIFFTDRFDVIHAANPPDHLFVVALPFKLFGVKFIFDHHDITPETFKAKFGKDGFFVNVLLLMERLTFKFADIVISTNESYKKIAITRGKKKESDVFIVRNGPDAEIMRKAKPNSKYRNGVKYLVGYVGVIGQQEGIENLLYAANYIVRKIKRTDVKFIVVGTGPHWKNVVKLCSELNLNQFVNFTGFIPDEELFEILSTVDVCVNPEYGNEFTDKSTMIKIMEYMTFGKPIVQFYTHEGEVTAGQAACYVKENSIELFAETLLQLLEDEPRRKIMGQIAIERIDNIFGWPRQKERLREAFEYLLGKESDIVSPQPNKN